MASYADSLLNTTYINSTKLAVIGNDLNVGGKLDVSGNLSVGGSTTLKDLEITGSPVINGDILVTGSVVTNYNPEYPPINAEADWEGVWSVSIDPAITNYNGYIAFVKQPNNTYTLYTNSVGAPQYDGLYFFQKYQFLAQNIVPVFTMEGDNVTENSVSIPVKFSYASMFPAYSTFVSRRLTTEDIGSNIAFAGTTATNNQYDSYIMFERILVPSDVSPVSGCDWFSAYQSEYNETRINNLTHVDVFDDLEGTYESSKRRMLRGMVVNKTGVDVITGEKLSINKLSPQPFIVENKFDKLKTDSDNYSLPVNRVHFGVYGKPNVMTFHYDWKTKNVVSPLASPFQEITIVNTSSPSTSVIGTIPTSFKFLPSVIEHQGAKQNCSGIGEPIEWFADNFVGVRLPLVVSGSDKIITITTTGPTSNCGVIPGTYTVTIPSGWVGYPHSLATFVTQNLDPDSGLRLDFYTLNKDLTNPDTFTDSSYISFFYLSSGTNTIPSVSVTCNDVTFLSDVLGLNTLSTAQNPNAGPIQLPVPVASGIPNYGNLQRGGFPMYTYNGNALDINNLYTPQSLPGSTSGLTINFSIGNVISSGNPRDFYNAFYYFTNLCCTEEHGFFGSIMVLADIDDEFYMPDTWEEAVYKFVDLNAFAIYTLGVQLFSTLNSSSPGTFGKAFENHAWNGTTTSEPFTGIAAARNATLAISAVTLEKYYKPSHVSALESAQIGYVVNNYLDLDNTFVMARHFTSTTTNLLDHNMASYWLPKYRGNSLPGDVNVGAETAVPYSVLLTDSSNSRYGMPQVFGWVVGILKQSVANSILPADASGSVCGYTYYGSGVYVTSTTVRNKIVSLFKSLGVKYAVTDVRGNPGGLTTSRMIPYGLDTNYVYVQINNCMGGCDWGSPQQTYNILSTPTIIADILDNSGNWPPAWRYPVDSSGITITVGGGVDNTTYKQTGNPAQLWVKTLASSPGNNTVDGSNNGQGLFSWCYLTDGNMYSAGKVLFYNFHDPTDSNDYSYFVGPNPPVTNTHACTYGVFNRIFYGPTALVTDWDYNDTVDPGNGGSLTQDAFYLNGNSLMLGLKFDLSGNFLGNSFNNPKFKFDALSNWSPLTLMTETGVYYDASGIQQAYTGGSHNAYFVSNDNINSYRDFRLERALQCAYTQRAGIRAQPKFGYMPIDVTNTVKIVDSSGVHQVYDPYNWDITDVSGALPLPANPFGL
jgi:hypothetical protein